MGGICQNLLREGLLEWVSETAKLEKELPIRFILMLKVPKNRLTGPLTAFLLYLVHLSQYQLISDLLQRREIRNVSLKHDQNHSFS